MNKGLSSEAAIDKSDTRAGVKIPGGKKPEHVETGLDLKHRL